VSAPVRRLAESNKDDQRHEIRFLTSDGTTTSTSGQSCQRQFITGIVLWLESDSYYHTGRISSIMSGILERAQETLSRAAVKTGKKMQELKDNDKLKQLNYDKKDPSPKSRFTTNTGAGVGNTDVWLKVASEKQGPMLLQDHHGREKVSF